jgi:hypothetical protein
VSAWDSSALQPTCAWSMLQELPCLGEFLDVSAFSESSSSLTINWLSRCLSIAPASQSAGAPTTSADLTPRPPKPCQVGRLQRSRRGRRPGRDSGEAWVECATLVGPNRRAPTGSASPGLLTGSPDGSAKSSVGLRAPRVLFIDTAACLPVEGRYTALPLSRSTDGKDTCRCEPIA